MSTRRISTTASVSLKPAATREQTEAEAQGWARLASRIAVPALHGQIALPERQFLVHVDVFAAGRCQLLMGDVIALSDRDPAVQSRLDRLVDGVCADLRAAAEETGQSVTLAECVPDLYLDRIRPGGWLDRWYLRRDLSIALLHSDTTVAVNHFGQDPDAFLAGPHRPRPWCGASRLLPLESASDPLPGAASNREGWRCSQQLTAGFTTRPLHRSLPVG